MKVFSRLHTTWTRFRVGYMERLRSAPRDAGYTTEAIIVIALVAVLALTSIGIVAAKVIGRATGISLE